MLINHLLNLVVIELGLLIHLKMLDPAHQNTFGHRSIKPDNFHIFKREFGRQIEIRCWESVDARTATPFRVDYEILEKLAGRIVNEVPGVVSVTYHIATKPPSTMEVV